MSVSGDSQGRIQHLFYGFPVRQAVNYILAVTGCTHLTVKTNYTATKRCTKQRV